MPKQSKSPKKPKVHVAENERKRAPAPKPVADPSTIYTAENERKQPKPPKTAPTTVHSSH